MRRRKNPLPGGDTAIAVGVGALAIGAVALIVYKSRSASAAAPTSAAAPAAQTQASAVPPWGPTPVVGGQVYDPNLGGSGNMPPASSDAYNYPPTNPWDPTVTT